MGKFLLFFLVIGFASVFAQWDLDYYNYDSPNDLENDNQSAQVDEKEDFSDILNVNSDENPESNEKVDDEILKYLESVFGTDDKSDDYQVEDNRSVIDEEKAGSDETDDEQSLFMDEEDKQQANDDKQEESDINNDLDQDDQKLASSSEESDIMDDEVVDDEPAEIILSQDGTSENSSAQDEDTPVAEEQMQLENPNAEFDVDDDSDEENDFADLDTKDAEVNQFSEETKKILEEDDGSDDISSVDADVNNQVEQKAVQYDLSDLKNDLQSLKETFDKLNDEHSESSSEEDIEDIADEKEKPEQAEEVLKNDNEDTNDSLANDDDNHFSDELKSLLEQMDKLTDEDSIDDVSDNSEMDDMVEDTNLNVQDYEDKYNRPYREGVVLKQRDNFDYEDIAEVKEEIAQVTEKNEPIIEESATTKEANQVNAKELTSSEVNEMMSKFALDHVEELDTQSDKFAKDTAAIHIKVTTEPTEITSPDYPSPYPTDNTVDWIIEGDGIGIELNVTDFNVNGFVGDYLLIKPGGIDDSGHNGLVFSYTLKSERRYRFLDVDRMFIRFHTNPGMAFFSGFKLSVRIISEPMLIEFEPTPSPEPVVSPPQFTYLVYLAGVTHQQFQGVEEDFRSLVADMATLYLNRNGLEIGNSSLSEVTQIVQTAICNINWPGFESCTAVRFGVPLDLSEDHEPMMNEDQLSEMWNDLAQEDPFAARLNRMGITEFSVPDDNSTLIVWMVISFGVVLSAAMLALALWRWSCVQDYTRMPAFSDSESAIGEQKKPLDLYPTPHQTLPPLYDDDFVKYNQEDEGRGHINQSYNRDQDFYEEYSDDEMDNDRFPNIKLEVPKKIIFD